MEQISMEVKKEGEGAYNTIHLFFFFYSFPQLLSPHMRMIGPRYKGIFLLNTTCPSPPLIQLTASYGSCFILI